MKQLSHRFGIAGNVLLCYLAASYPSNAQIVPDATLRDRTQVRPDGNTSIIEGGTRAGGNLFHSFESFSVPTGGTAYFNNALDVQNILSRVTGGSISNIDGLIRANGTANLFLINPNGIVFGPNARLNIGGSFFASTANSIQFSDGTFFSAKETQTQPLLTVSVPIGLQYGGNAGEIRLQGSGQNLADSGTGGSFDSSLNPLEVNHGNTLAFVGGNITIDGGILQAPGGRIELGGLAGEGTVAINPDNSLSFPSDVPRGDVSIINRAGLNVIAGNNGGGSIVINARNIDISGGSLLTSGLTSDLGTVDNPAGDVTLNATDGIAIQQSRIENNLNSGTTGIGGNIFIETNSLTMTGGASVDVSTYGQGNAGFVSAIANGSVILADNQTSISSNVYSGAEGDAGGVLLTADSLSMMGGASLDSSTFGKGNAGFVDVQVNGSVSLAGSGTTIYSIAEGNTEGNAGYISIYANSISLTDGAALKSDNLASGLAGNITLNGTTQVSLTNSEINSTSQSDSTDSFGNITITAPSGSLLFNQAQINTTNSGAGYAGNIILNARDNVELLNQTDISSQGYLGQILIGRSEISGETSSPQVVTIDSSFLSTTNFDSTRLTEVDAGLISIDATNSFSLLNGSNINTITARLGVAGNVTITSGGNADIIDSKINSDIAEDVEEAGNAGDISITASGIVAIFKSEISSQVLSPTATGNGGNITITGSSIFLESNTPTGITTTTSGSGNAGYIQFTASDRISIARSDISSDTSGAGNAGVITLTANGLVDLVSTYINSQVRSGASGQGGTIAIEAGSVSLTDLDKLETSTFDGSGNAGDISIFADGPIDIIGSSILSNANEAATGNAGNLWIQSRAGSITISGGSLIESSNYISGNAGNVTLDAHNNLSITNSNIFSDAYSDAYSLNTNSGGGLAGIIDLSAGNSLAISLQSQITADNYGEDTGSASDNLYSGYITISAGTFYLSDNSLISATTNGSQRGGDIDINAQSVFITNASTVQSSTFGSGNAGNVTITASGTVSIANSGISSASETAQGYAGNISIKTSTLDISDGTQLISSNYAGGDAGYIDINAPAGITITDSFIASDAYNENEGLGGGLAGYIQITANEGSFTVTDSSITADSFGGEEIDPSQNSGLGYISINARTVSLSNQSLLGARTFGAGAGGYISIDANSINVSDRSTFTTSTFGAGAGGYIKLTTPSLLLTGGSRVEAIAQGSGSAGYIEINPSGFNASDTVTLSGITPVTEEIIDGVPTGNLISRSSGLFANTDAPESGLGGSIIINTGTLRVTDGAVVSARTQSINRGGNIEVNVRNLDITGGGQILANAFSSGAAGNITVNATNSVTLSGSDPTYQSRLNQVVHSLTNSGLTEQDAQQQARLRIDPDSPYSGLSVNSTGTGTGGNITITAPLIRLNNQATITANTQSGGQGNVTLNTQILQLRHNSRISTNSKNANGGNITINTQTLTALENSDITANAEFGTGGRVIITAKGIFGTEYRPRLTAESDITATSNLGAQFSGTVEINTPDVDPSSGLVELSTDVIDPTNQIAQGCESGKTNEFTVTGRGGLPPNPSEYLSDRAVWVDFGTPSRVNPSSSSGSPQSSRPSNKGQQTTNRIIEAQGWTLNNKGEVVLTATAPTLTPQRSGLRPLICK